jgi:hypothetical protein
MTPTFADRLTRTRAMYQSGEEAARRTLRNALRNPIVPDVSMYPAAEQASFHLGYHLTLRHAPEAPTRTPRTAR